MTIITKGMGAVLKAIKSAKRGIIKPKTNKPLYAAGAIAVGQKAVREKLKEEWIKIQV